MKTAVRVLPFLIIAIPALAQETIRITFDDPPTQLPGTGRLVTNYYESGILFTPLKGSRAFGRTGAATSGLPDDGTAFVQTALGDTLQFRFTNGSAFDLLAVDLAEYSTLFQTPMTVPFVGYRHNGTTVATNFTTDGIIDGTGPLADFQTFYFGPEFSSLEHVEIPVFGYSLDNLVVRPVQLSRPPDSIQFGAVTYFQAGGQRYPARTMLAGDFNGDGIPDLAVLGSGEVDVLLGIGNGAFGAPIATSFSSGPGVMAAADFNGDGKLDLVVAEGNFAYILLGDGSGAFPISSTLTNYASGAVAVAANDFNGDGKVDLAFANFFGIRFALSQGDGSFAPPVTYGLINRPTDMRAADINGDGKLDLVVSLLTTSSANPTNSDSFCVLRNNGSGGFNSPQYYAGTARDDHYSLEVADFMGDGKPHVAVLNYYSNSITFWVNQGGVFVQTNEYSLPSFPSFPNNPTNLTVGDFNGDGRMDLLIGSGTTQGPGGNPSHAARFWMLLGDGGMSFTSGGELMVKTNTAYPRPTVVADYNGDRKPDLAFINDLSIGIVLNESLPTLTISRLDTYNEITWSTILGSGFTLEYTTNISPPTSWQTSAASAHAVGYWTRVVDGADGEAKFYRLKK